MFDLLCSFWQYFPQLIKAAGDTPLELLQRLEKWGFDIYHGGPWTVDKSEAWSTLFKGEPVAKRIHANEVDSMPYWKNHVYINLFFEQRNLQKCLERVAMAKGY